MSFGKRGATPARVPRPAPSAGQHPDATDNGASGGGGGSVLRSQLGRIGIGVAIALGLVALDRLALKYVMSDHAARFEQRAAAIQWSTILPAPHKARTETEQRLARACLNLLPVRRSEGVSDEAAFAWSLGRGEMAQMVAVGDYLACSIDRAPDRLCAPSERAKLIADIRTFLGYRKTVLRRDAEERLLNDGRVTPQTFHKRFDRPASIETAPEADATLERISVALKGAVELGYLRGAELAPLRSTELAETLGPVSELTSSERPCQ